MYKFIFKLVKINDFIVSLQNHRTNYQTDSSTVLLPLHSRITNEVRSILFQSVSKYGEMIEAGKRVIVAFTDRPHEFSSTYQPSEVRSKFEWIWTSETNIEKHWAYTTNVDKLKV